MSKDNRAHALNSQLSVRIDRTNPNHHLWNNHGTWWCHYTVHTPDYQAKRVRINLHTASIADARAARDRLLARLDTQVDLQLREAA